MPNVQPCEQGKDDLPHDKVLNNLIRTQVINALGKPPDLLKVQVRKVWDNHYRVNVLVGTDGGSTRFANSYFVVTDSSGGLITSTPKITKLY